MVFQKRIVKPFFFAFCLAFSLSACSGYYNQQDSYVARDGAVKTVPSDYQACVSSCNADFDRCSETTAASQPVGRGQLTGVLGAKAGCQDALRRCLDTCRGR